MSKICNLDGVNFCNMWNAKRMVPLPKTMISNEIFHLVNIEHGAINLGWSQNSMLLLLQLSLLLSVVACSRLMLSVVCFVVCSCLFVVVCCV